MALTHHEFFSDHGKGIFLFCFINGWHWSLTIIYYIRIIISRNIAHIHFLQIYIHKNNNSLPQKTLRQTAILPINLLLILYNNEKHREVKIDIT